MYLLQLTAAVCRNFYQDGCLVRAAALSFTTLLSFVPLFALAFSVLKGFGVQNRLAPLILQQVAAGSEVVVTRVITYINNTNVGSLGAIGLVALLFTVVNMLGSIEEAFNAIWGVAETRTFYRKFSDYLSVLVVAPLLLLAATSITGSLQNRSVVVWILERTYLGDVFLFLLQLAPYLSVWVAIFLLYILMPNTRVRYPSAFFGAVLAGTLWEFAQWGYIHFQVGVGNYNAVYGTLAALPILMVWINVSWLIVLFGMEVVALHQNLRCFRREMRGDTVSQSLRETVALATLRRIAEAFHRGEPSWTEESLAVRLRVPLRVMRQTLAQLEEAGFIVPTGSGESYHPSRELDQIAVRDVLLSLRSHGADCRLTGEEATEMILETVDRAVAEALGNGTLKELVEEPEKGAAVVDKEDATGI
ncbi:YhjD/YihY/BrkB family envelope integrity protein [Geomesophilobacter sediminis]|uniref:YhjD/YihY/BrkB family envelope integrity protein n=1 Tax=Geomesophilobacter sediminis TaxID=2798584 RepID=UPI002E2DD688|nr:YhjD/YihY/BrkB family envelope integrity protein [Geomesophilobacter sediminis]